MKIKTYETVFPARAKAYDGREIKNRIVESKLDGSHYLMHFASDRVYITSRRTSVKTNLPVEKGLNCPHFQITNTKNILWKNDSKGSLKKSGIEEIIFKKNLKVPKSLIGTVLDGEIYHDQFSMSMSVMGANPDVAKMKQNEIGNVRFKVFDILFYEGKDIRKETLRLRWSLLKLFLTTHKKILPKEIELVKRYGKADVKKLEKHLPTPDYLRFIDTLESAGMPVQSWDNTIRLLFYKEAVIDKGEGLIVKDETETYGTTKAWWKVKKVIVVDVVIMGYKEGTGKYVGQVGSLEIGMYSDKGTLIPCGYAGGMDDEIRTTISEDFDSYNRKVIEVICQEVTDKLKLRHPRCMPDEETGIRFRDDKDEEDCTIEDLRQFLKGE